VYYTFVLEVTGSNLFHILTKHFVNVASTDKFFLTSNTVQIVNTEFCDCFILWNTFDSDSDIVIQSLDLC